MLQADAGANHDDDENGNDDGGNTQGATDLSVAGCSWEQQEVVVPDAADEHEAGCWMTRTPTTARTPIELLS